jgi:hypothetical protein
MQRGGSSWCPFTDMKSTTPFRIRLRRFITDRYAYRARPDFLTEFIAIAIIVLTAVWPIVALADELARPLK